MSTAVIIFIVVGAIVILGAATAWLVDARRNKDVADNDDRFHQH